MATFTDTGFLTLVDITKTLRPDGSVETDMAQLMQKKTPFIEDIPWVEANEVSGHLVTSVVGLPEPTWRGYNEGSPTTKGEFEQYVEKIGMLEDFSRVDVKLAERNGQPNDYRLSQDRLKVQGFGQKVEQAFLYESVVTSPKAIHGLTPRYPASSGYTASDYVIALGSLAGSNARSIWLINWDPDSMFGIFPKGSVAGLQQVDRGIREVTSPVNGLPMEAYVTKFNWDCGLTVKDYRRAVRMQWDPDDVSHTDGAKTLYLGLQRMLDTVHDLGPNARFYMDRVSMAKINAQLASNVDSSLTWVELNGRLTPHFRGIPIRISEILTGESAIS